MSKNRNCHWPKVIVLLVMTIMGQVGSTTRAYVGGMATKSERARSMYSRTGYLLRNNGGNFAAIKVTKNDDTEAYLQSYKWTSGEGGSPVYCDGFQVKPIAGGGEEFWDLDLVKSVVDVNA
eukprot:275553_1